MNRSTIQTCLGVLRMVALSWCVAACSGSGSGAEREGLSKLLDDRGQPRTISGTLGNASGDVKVAAKTEDGQSIQGKVDVKTGRFSVPVPKNQKAALSVCSGGETKKVAFDRNGSGGGKADGHSPEPSYEIPATDFTDRVDLGLLDLSESGDTLILGDEAGENSIWQFVDSDGDGIPDLDDTDDDGDGVLDVDDADWEDVDAWIESEDDFWDYIEEVEACDWDTDLYCEGMEIDCADPSYADFCYFEEDEAYVSFCWEDAYVGAIEADPALVEIELCDVCDALTIDDECYTECVFDLCAFSDFDTP